VCGAVAVVRC